MSSLWVIIKSDLLTVWSRRRCRRGLLTLIYSLYSSLRSKPRRMATGECHRCSTLARLGHGSYPLGSTCHLGCCASCDYKKRLVAVKWSMNLRSFTVLSFIDDKRFFAFLADLYVTTAVLWVMCRHVCVRVTVCLSVCNVAILWLNAQTDRVELWCERRRRQQLLCNKRGFGSDHEV